MRKEKKLECKLKQRRHDVLINNGLTRGHSFYAGYASMAGSMSEQGFWIFISCLILRLTESLGSEAGVTHIGSVIQVNWQRSLVRNCSGWIRRLSQLSVKSEPCRPESTSSPILRAIFSRSWWVSMSTQLFQ